MADVARFPFLTVTDAQGKSIPRPMLPLRLSYRGQSLDAVGLVDSGADVNVLPYGLGIALGAIWEERQTSLELSGNMANYEARGLVLTVTVGEFSPVQLAFAWTRAERAPLILGQTNFFMEYNVCFFRSERLFEIQPK